MATKAPKATKAGQGQSGLAIQRRFTRVGQDPYAAVAWTTRTSRITNPDGSIVFEMKDAEVPASWSQVATDIMVSKYFRKAGVPQLDDSGEPMRDERGTPVLGPERSAKQVIGRLAGCWRHWGETHGYFATADDALAFEDELKHMLVSQMAAPNSPQWFNTGLAWAYGITGPAQGHYYVDPAEPETVKKSTDAYTRPQPHACFIQHVEDDLVNEDGIMDLWVREARIFKYGSGTGTNFSSIRGEGEPLSGGGTSSGLMSFLRVGDRAAGAIKSGGTTRRAAKMVVLDVDHPDIETFVDWKPREELKVAAMVEGMKHLSPEQQARAKELGLELTYDYNGEAYATVSGQNSNNSVRLSNAFIGAVRDDKEWTLTRRTDGQPIKTVRARELWTRIAEAAWQCADPGVQFDTTINEWHTSPEGGRINASNPCVTGDTLIATTDGYRRIDELVGSTVEVIGGDGAASAVTKVFPTGIKPVFDLQTKSGYRLRLTADHRVLTANRGDVPAHDLRQGDRVLLQGAGFGKRTLGREIAEVLGVAVGDGCQTGAQGHIFITVSKEEADLAAKMLNSIDDFTATADDGRARRARTVVETPTSLRVGTSAAPLRALAARYTVLNRGSTEKRFTDEVFELDRGTQAALLRGLFTADGTVADYDEKSQYVSLDSTSLPLLEQVQLMLLAFGIKAKIYRNRTVVSDYEMPGGIYQRQVIHSLRISRSSRLRFAAEIGFMAESPKAARLAAMNERVTTYRDRMDDEFRSLEPVGVEPVYDLTEPRTSHFVANGMVVHNCSEYMFLDNTACNLASLNLIKFLDVEKGTFDVDGFRHAVRLWTIVLEISVLMAQFPSREIARLSYDYRTLGLGYANIGTVLMILGMPYDSDAARAYTGAVTALMTGESYAASAELAGVLGPFPEYPKNAPHMLRVIRNHRRAAYDAKAEEYEGLSVLPMGIDTAQAPTDILVAAQEAWDKALAEGEKHGYRNAQTTLLAPTGTIGLLMDCDTTGVEPDFALVKFKKLAGGGYFKIANQSLAPALKTLGYDEAQRKDILTYVLGTLSLDGAPHINRQSLTAKGLNEEDLGKIEAALPGVFELPFAFNAWTLGEEAIRRLGLSMEQATAPGFDLLRALGFTRAQIEEANEVVCGTMTVEGAPHLKPEHYAVFDTANKSGKKGTRFIHHMGHIKMMSAAQSFLSGAISKTINMPNEVTIEEVEDAYYASWQHGIKAMALYRDGSKMSQPLANKSDVVVADKEELQATIEATINDAVAAAVAEKDAEIAALKAQVAELTAAKPAPAMPAVSGQVSLPGMPYKPTRRRLPAKRHGFTQEARVAGHKVFLRTGEYEDGTIGEIFIDMHKEGAAFRSMINSFAIAVSKGLQYGVPLEEFVETFTFVRFEPQGMVAGHPNIKLATSVIDYVFRVLGLEYLGRTDLVQVEDAPKPIDQTGEDSDLLPKDEDMLHPTQGIGTSPAQRIASPAAPAVPTATNGYTNGRNGTSGHDHGQGDLAGLKVEARAAAPEPTTGVATAEPASASAGPVSAVDAQLSNMMGDAPFCDVCGHITVRNGACYKCLNCGNSLGCS